MLLFPDDIDRLTVAVTNGNLDLVKSLVENGVDVNKLDNDMYTPLFYAVENNQYEIAEYLLEHGADPNADYTVTLGPGQSVPIIDVALYHDNIEMIDLLLKYGAYQNNVKDYYNTKMYEYIHNSNFINAEELILNGMASLQNDMKTTLIKYESGSILQRLFIEKYGSEGITDGTYSLLNILINGDKLDNTYDLPFPMSTSFLHDQNNYLRYSALMAFDNDLSTSWVEGVDDSGTGEKLAFRLDGNSVILEVVPGYGDERYFHSNNRVKKAVVIFYRIERSASMDPSENWIHIVPLNYSLDLYFEDELSYQAFYMDIPGTMDEGHNQYEIIAVLEILEVYPGSKWDDTCIAEIRIDY
jgi:hypothetical protein